VLCTPATLTTPTAPTFDALSGRPRSRADRPGAPVVGTDGLFQPKTTSPSTSSALYQNCTPAGPFVVAGAASDNGTLVGVTEQQRYDTLTAATDRAAAADRAPWAIIGPLLTAPKVSGGADVRPD
jgi:hypothetical protein